MPAIDLVLRRGQRVADWGRVLSHQDGTWLDLSRSEDEPASASLCAVPLVGPAAPTSDGNGQFVAGWVLVTGIWRDGAIEVEKLEQYTPTWEPPPWATRRGGDFTEQELADAVRVLTARFREWQLFLLIQRALDADRQPYIRVATVHVRAALAEWIDTLPEGLVVVEALLRPCGIHRAAALPDLRPRSGAS